ncbi:gp16 family protein [Aquitalea aquatica]|uniref:Regulatory protein GemA n=1 Tax=Aquitalea aquatica TaxID=3044273 RepID=A0A838Y2Q2_9NEIS|nr:regulatory protein GemA [Aquitalea magnusonii]MBA4709553.1 regulatory protein GemA [Aquitalea magnusonii]
MKDPRQALIAKLHIARQQLAMHDADYRSLLARIVPGCSSSTQLDQPQLVQVLAEMQRLGFVPRPGLRHGKRPQPSAGRQALMGKIAALLAEAGRPWPYVDAMARRMFQIDKVDWLDTQQLHKLVAALMIDARRAGRKTE